MHPLIQLMSANWLSRAEFQNFGNSTLMETKCRESGDDGVEANHRGDAYVPLSSPISVYDNVLRVSFTTSA